MPASRRTSVKTAPRPKRKVAGGRRVARAPRAVPFPPLSVPSLPTTGNYCIWRFNKVFDGPISGQPATPYRCRTGPTRHSQTQVVFKVGSIGGPTCDQPIPGLLTNFQLQAKGATIHRQDGLAHFMGQFIFIDMATNTKLFEGTMELIGQIGSHQSLGETCDQDKHVEGWLVGAGVGSLSQYCVRAVVTCQLHANLPTGTALDTTKARMTGVIVKAP